MTTKEMKHISVCICTYKRPEYLRRLLLELSGLESGDLFSYSIVVADNDHLESAKVVVTEFAAASTIPVRYCVEPRQNIALARNMAVMNAEGSYVAFIDDDEFPAKDWLLLLFRALEEYKVDGVLGPVKPYFEAQPPQWIVEGAFHERPMHRTGLNLDWNQCRTGNVLLKRHVLTQESQPFRPQCLSGEDQDFFRRITEKGCTVIWCNEAVVYEFVPPARWKRSFLVKRALLRGVFSLRNHGFPPMRIVKSLVAVPLYALALPIALVFGQARFMRCVFKFSYHLGRLFALVGVNPIRQPYLTD
jgi:glycosyltransferase involved in cell wall biosynthesis